MQHKGVTDLHSRQVSSDITNINRGHGKIHEMLLDLSIDLIIFIIIIKSMHLSKLSCLSVKSAKLMTL